MFYNLVQIVGSLLILTVFVAAVTGRMQQSSYAYLVANAIGSTVLTVTAIIRLEWGFLLLEGVWALVSIYSILRRSVGRSVSVAH